MRKIFTLAAAILITAGAFSQAPQKMSYQCVIRNSSGVLVTNQSIGIRITILQGTPLGTVTYQETYSPNPQTNSNGLVTIEIGGGIPVTGTFSSINWASGPYYLKTETDPTGGTSYTIIGTSQLLSVPYALYSKTSGTADYNALSNLPVLNITNWNTAFGWGNHAGLYRPIGWVPGWSDVTGKPGFATVATSGSYNDLSNKPTILNSQWTTSGSDIYFNTGNVGLGTSSPTSKLHIVSNSTLSEPQLKLYENASDYARLTFQNSSGASYWLIGGFNYATNSSEKLVFYNSTSGNVMSFSGDGNAGIGADPASGRKVNIVEDGNQYGLHVENNGSTTTVYGKNNGTGPAAYFLNNSTSYTLYSLNSGTGPAAYFDGSVYLAGGNTAEVNRTQTGSANILPICYGSVEASGTKNTGGSTSNFTVTKIGTGVYDIIVSGETYAQTTHTCIASLGDAGFINTNAYLNNLRVYTYNTTGAASDREFSFVIYKP
jgi:trimeric autotransporter adhesin